MEVLESKLLNEDGFQADVLLKGLPLSYNNSLEHPRCRSRSLTSTIFRGLNLQGQPVLWASYSECSVKFAGV